MLDDLPDYITYVEGYPMTANGKIQKIKLREFASKRLQFEDAGATA